MLCVHALRQSASQQCVGVMGGCDGVQLCSPLCLPLCVDLQITQQEANVCTLYRISSRISYNSCGTTQTVCQVASEILQNAHNPIMMLSRIRLLSQLLRSTQRASSLNTVERSIATTTGLASSSQPQQQQQFYNVPAGHINSDLSNTKCHIGLGRLRDLTMRQDLQLVSEDGTEHSLAQLFKVCPLHDNTCISKYTCSTGQKGRAGGPPRPGQGLRDCPLAELYRAACSTDQGGRGRRVLRDSGNGACTGNVVGQGGDEEDQRPCRPAGLFHSGVGVGGVCG